MAQAAAGSPDHGTGIPVTTVTTPVRVTDLDFQRHMGNTAFTDLFANARFTYLHDQVWPELDFEQHVIALVRLEVDFAGQVHHPAVVETTTQVTRVGRSSLGLGQEMRSDGKVVARSNAVLVLTERGTGSSTPWPPAVARWAAQLE